MSDRLAILGGTPVRPEGYPDWPEVDETDVDAVTAVVRSGRWAAPAPGPLAKAFGERFAMMQGARHGILMMNGTVTMEVALRALDIGSGRRGHRAGADVRRHGLCPDRGRRAAGHRRRPPRHLVDRP